MAILINLKTGNLSQIWHKLVMLKCCWCYMYLLKCINRYFILHLTNERSGNDCILFLVYVDADAELDESSAEDRIASQYEEVSADDKHQLRVEFDAISRRFGFQTELVVLKRANSLALCFNCMTLSAVMGLCDLWRSGQLRDILESLFTLLSGAAQTVRIKRLTLLPINDARCLDFCSSVQGLQTSRRLLE